MPVMTKDILLEDVRRDDLFEWLGNMENHLSFLNAAAKSVDQKSPNELTLTISSKFKARQVGYILKKKDDEHGGRRIRIETTGKRSSGLLSYSLRTMKPSRNTMLTITWDYKSGSLLGMALEQLSLQESYETFLGAILQNIKENKDSIPKISE